MALILRFPLVASTLLAGLCVGVLLGLGQMPAAQATATIYALAVATYRAVSMIRDLFRGRWGIDLLAVTAIVSTLVVGEYIAALIIVLMLTGGDALEEFAHGRATHELKALLERAPRIAHRETPGNPVEEVPVRSIRSGDTLLVKPSEIVPVDGLLLSPAGTFDESSLTGESLPVEHGKGDALMSGSVNGEEAVRMVASATAADSQYGRIVALVQEAAASRAPTVRLADRYAVPFTLFAFLLAGIAWYVSQDPERFAQVLVVATPCPLLIAAPVAFLAGTSRAARSGIIIKNAGTLEQLARVRTAVFDKTGTLTHGRPALQAIRVAPTAAEGTSPGRILQLAASAEQSSSHVLAASVIDAARSCGLLLLPVSSANEHATQGVTAVCGDQTVVVGKAGFVGSATTGFEQADVASGQLRIYVGVDKRFAGTLIMSDPLRENAVATLAQLRRLGVRETLLLTGDTLSTASHIAAEAGITRVLADCLPADKVAAVAELNHRPVMMVGDGVNDAPVLAASDVGVAMGAKGATAASESADVVIMLDDLSKVADAVDIGRRTIHIARTSIWTGILLSAGLMAAAAFGFVPAVAGALLQELVDLAAILNALRALGRSRTPGAYSPEPVLLPLPSPKIRP
ncbi:cadmium-translocating P-type ATPase [Arthrobacter bambusae]|uniref:heavy metal translocating P-type ATPase n=1 Tax=Arthrobacter TaxID=1663 RepID=UPI001F511DBE|nr:MULTISPECIES: heavy metal translocating P-type ATPase [Arthrobacter]MCI0141717.1 cadmium-translocating P-type ATPase [Arthrobacter bambusae]UYY83212.1 heavy metal translocating P-type ATPase [Arthrobacter sp. YA7-1]